MISLKKIFLIAFFAIFLMPFSAFASVPTFTHKDKDCSYYAIIKNKSSGYYYAFCSKTEFIYYPNEGGTPYFSSPVLENPVFEVFIYDPSQSKWISSGTIREKFFFRPSKEELIYSNFDIKKADGTVFFSARPPYLNLMELEKIPALLIRQAGGILSVVLTGFAILLVVGLVPRWRSWFLRL